MDLSITRRAYLPAVTLGVLTVGTLSLFTLERPWIRNPAGHGGMPRQSCVPDGIYTVRPHSSVKFPNVYALYNELNGVYYQTLPAGQAWGRTAILIHIGNMVDNVIGCIAIGMRYGVVNGKHFVFESGAALDKLRSVLGRTDLHTLNISPTRGTV